MLVVLWKHRREAACLWSVCNVGDWGQIREIHARGEHVIFIFETQLWQDMKVLKIILTQRHRQADEAFLKILDEMYQGKLSPGTERALEARVTSDPEDADCLRVFAKNAPANELNTSKFNALSGQSRDFFAADDGEARFLTGIDKVVPEKLTLKVGTMVMVLRNLKNGLRNGSRGRVLRFEDATGSSKT